MLIKNRVNLAALLAAIVAGGMLAGCSTPCSAPGGLCAPEDTITRTIPAPTPVVLAPIPPPPAAVVTTSPIDVPDDVVTASTEERKVAGPVRIALLLPLDSITLGAPAEAIRAGFMAAYATESSGVTIDLVPSDDTVDATVAAYGKAAARNDVIVGPLPRPAVAAIAAGPVTKPTLALNHLDDGAPLPANMLSIGLAIEDEARQVAAWAHADFPTGRPLVLAGTAPWQRRLASAFHDRWNVFGNVAYQVELPVDDGQIPESVLADLKTRIDLDHPDFLFAALDAEQLREVRAALGTSLPAYGTSSINPGGGAGYSVAELDGVHMLDLPWQVQPDHPAAMTYPRRQQSARGAPDMDRLYALGIDAYRVAHEMAMSPGRTFRIDGVTGQLRIETAPPGFERSESRMIYRGGNFEAVAGDR